MTGCHGVLCFSRLTSSAPNAKHEFVGIERRCARCFAVSTKGLCLWTVNSKVGVAHFRIS